MMLSNGKVAKMHDKKPTDNEIKKALECCLDSSPSSCKKCPLFNVTNSTMVCSKIVIKFALDLINRLQARVEKCEKVEHFADKTIATLQAENEEQGEIISSLEREIEKLYYELDLRIQEKRVVEAETRKEFAERLKEKHRRITDYDEAGFGCQVFVVEEDCIDNLLKELVGDNE